MTSTEIAVRENGHAVAERDVVDGWLAVASDVIKLANVIAETEFVPAEYRDSPPAVAAAILVGRELGIGPMMSLRHVQLVKGTPTLSAEYKRARVLAAGHDFEIEELNTTRCRVRGRRTGTAKWLEVTFTIEDARTAGLIKDKGAWRTRPRRMLFARAGSELCDFLFADVVNGLPTAELVADGVDGDEFAGYDEAPAQASPLNGDKPAQRTARRRQVPAAGDDTQPEAAKTPGRPAAASRRSAAPPPPQAAPSGLPPLPGEEEDPGPAALAEHETPVSGPAAGPGTTGKDAPGSATRGKGGQLTALWTVLNEVFGFGDDEKDKARLVVEHIAGRRLDGGTTGDLSYNEAKTVLDTLANWQKVAESRGERPRDTLIAILVESGQEAGDDAPE